MKIRSLTIEGFRSLKHVEWKPGDLNVLIGPNGSGKSNLLRFLELISASARGKLDDLILASGGIDSILWDGRAKALSFHLLTDWHLQGSPINSHTYSLELALVRSGRSNDHRIEREYLVAEAGNGDSTTLLKHEKRTGWLLDAEVLQEDLMASETLLSRVANFVSPVIQHIGTLNEIRTYKNRLTNWAIYQDILTHPGAPIRQAPVARRETRLTPNGDNLVSVMHTIYSDDNSNFKQDIDLAMNAAFGDDFEELIFPPAADQRIQMRVRWKSLQRTQSTADLSDGTLRFLFLIAALADPDPPDLIAIDEPETGLHPTMLPIVAEYAVEASRRTQVILSTHSAEFLSAFTETRPTTTVFKWEKGETSLQVLDQERLAYWLKEYTLGQLYRSGELENMAEPSEEQSDLEPVA